MSDSIILADAHVHVHATAEPACLLDAAARNFASVAQRLGAKEWQGILLLAEMANVDWFDSVAGGEAPTNVGGWSLTPSEYEEITLHARVEDGSLVIVAGRQIVTAEKIEVLALGTRARIPDGLNLAATVGAAHNAGATVVLPWGVGKWLGKRGKLVARALAEARESNVFAGDNSGRPAFWPEPSAFKSAKSQGRPVLPGTDPLPLPLQERRVGSVGFWMAGHLSKDSPGTDLQRELLRAAPASVRAYGPRESTIGFFRNQIALRMNKH